MKLLHTANTLGPPRSQEDLRKIAHRTRELFGELLKHTIDTTIIDGRPVFVTLHHHAPDGTANISTSPADAMENFDAFHNSRRKIGVRSIRLDTPIPPRRDLATSASRLRIDFFAPTGQQRRYSYDLTAYRPPVESAPDFDPADFQPPSRLHFRDDGVRHQLLIRNHTRGRSDGYEIRTAVQSESDVVPNTKIFAPLGDLVRLEAAEKLRVLPILTPQEQQVLSLGAHALVNYQLRQDLSIMSALAGQDPAQPMGVY